MNTEPVKVDVLAVGAHPDDVELSCSGTLALLRKQNKKTGVLDLTVGEMATRGNPEQRKAEAMQAAQILDLEFRTFLDFPDARFEINSLTIEKVIRIIRSCRPEIVLCNAPSDRHPDHGKAAELITQACFYSGLSKWKTMNHSEEQDAFRPGAVYHYVQDYFLKPDFLIDVTPVVEIKMKSIRAYSSQFYNPESREPETPISGKDFFDAVLGKMRTMGRYIGVTYAEGFIFSRPMGVKNIFDLY